MNQQQLYENLGGIFIKVISLILGMERDLEEGEYGKVVKAVERKHICPVCRKAFDSQGETVEHFFEDHSVDDLESR